MRFLLLALVLAGPAQAGIISGGGPTDALSAATAAGTYVQKAGDTMTGRLTAPDATLTYGLNVGTVTLSTIGNKIRFDNARRAIFVNPAGANPVTISNHAGAGSIAQFALDFDDSDTDAGMFPVVTINNAGLTSAYGLTAATGSFSGSVTASSGTFTASASTQVVAKGMSCDGNAAAYNGCIGVGDTQAFRGAISYDGASRGVAALNIGNTWSNASAEINLIVGPTATPAAPSMAIRPSAVGIGADPGAYPFRLKATTDVNLRVTHDGAGNLRMGAGTDASTWDANMEIRNAKTTFATGNVIVDAGKLGIGTASPCSTCTLHVAGGASVTGALAVGQATFTVTTTGIVSAPSQPAFSGKSAEATGATTLTWNKIYFGTVNTNTQGMSVATSSNIVTIPAGGAGGYLVSCFADIVSASGTASDSLAISVNGTGNATVQNNGLPHEAGAVTSIAVPMTLLTLAAGNTVECNAFNANATGTIAAGAWMTVVKVL